MAFALILLFLSALACLLVFKLIVLTVSKVIKTVKVVERNTSDVEPVKRVVTPDVINYEQAQPESTIKRQSIIAEQTVDSALRGLQENRYFVFKDLIIPSSSRSIGLTQIDHVLVSRTGIFCIETKSNRGNIYGFTRAEKWKQYLGNGGKPYEMNSPFRQNRHHVSSLSLLLSDYLKAPVHSYIAFPNAHKVVVDSRAEDMSPSGVIKKIARHTQTIYEPAELERIAKTLAHVGTLREQLRDRHIKEVKAFVNSKVDSTIKLKASSHVR